MPPSVKTVKGTFSCTSKGFGFVTVEGEDDDYYIHEKNMNGAFHEDTVLMQVLDDHPTSGRRKRRKDHQDFRERNQDSGRNSSEKPELWVRDSR